MSNLWLLTLILIASCAIEVGNPHPTSTGGGKSAVQLTLQSNGDLAVDQVDLNLVGLKLIRRDAETRNISFSSFKEITIKKSQGEAFRIYKGSTQKTGNYDRVRMYFNKENFGKVISKQQEYPLSLGQQESFLDVPIQFSLRYGELTKINLTIDAADIIQEIKDGSGQVTSYQVNANQMSAEANSEVEDVRVITDEPAYKKFRIAVSKVNDGSEFHMQRLALMVNGTWETSVVEKGDGVTDLGNNKSGLNIGSYSVIVSASGNSKDAWRIFANDEIVRNIYEKQLQNLDRQMQKNLILQR